MEYRGRTLCRTTRGTAAPSVNGMDIEDTAIEVRGLTKSYGSQPVLTGLDLTVRSGEILGIVGPNGAGKTTTVEIMQGLRPRDGGQVDVLGHDPAHERRALRRLVGAQLQSSALPERLRVGEALRLFTHLAGDVVDPTDLMDQWDLHHLARRSFGTLSGGQQQRLFVALALAGRPRVVFLDELTQGLDPAACRETWQLIEHVRQRGSTVVLVTHDMVEAGRLCDRIAILHEGRVRAVGTVPELIELVRRPVHTRFSVPTADLPGLDTVPGVEAVQHDGTRVTVRGDGASPVLVAAELARRRIVPTDLCVEHPALDDVFLELTGGQGDA